MPAAWTRIRISEWFETGVGREAVVTTSGEEAGPRTWIAFMFAMEY